MDHFVVTITRQFGSLGRPIARQMSEILGIDYYDRDIVEDVSKKLNLPVSQISDSEEQSNYRFWRRMFPLGTDKEYMQNIIFDVQKELIKELAGKSSCILVGRCSDAILETNKNNTNIYVYAPVEKRLENCVKRLEMSETEARRTISDVDRARDAYHKKYAGFLPSDTAHKHLMIDSSLLGPEETARWIAEIARKRFNL